VQPFLVPQEMMEEMTLAMMTLLMMVMMMMVTEVRSF
jgi:hypothetical protein